MSDKLYIIGNGFDLAHGISSRYSDYKDWLLDNGYARFKAFLETHFPCNDKDWKDFETALGRYDIDEMVEEITEGLSIDTEHLMRSKFIYEDASDIFMGPDWNRVRDLFKEWVNSISLNGIVKNFKVEPSSLFFTFNYTLTLEKIYEVKLSSILHIHGIANSNQKLIVGHNNPAKLDPSFIDAEWQCIETVRERVKTEMNMNVKPVKKLIDTHKSYFASLGHVNNVIVIGHSYSDVDFPYYDEIRKYANPNAIWTFGYHTERDRLAANAYRMQLGLSEHNSTFVKI